ncbi:hypothetical protein D6D19_02802 [Aureobasidium pullulans]|uniref:Jacalin-type lectin domain-containing protein n=1 Tax=Aureobasidium pullulans TaxID=5580 RepID=A0A4V6TAK9_AURPU|nr:hypothetical protein D6D19_02802 [Aureobasidium pullulans]
MPSFLREFRRRSKASTKTDKTSSGNDGQSHSSSNDSRSQDGTTAEPVPDMPRNKSSSTLNSIFGGKSPPMPAGSPPLPSVPSISGSHTNLAGMNGSKTPPLGSRPGPSNNNSSRYSIAGSVNGSPKPSPYASPLAPRVISASEGSWVHQKVLLIYGQVGDPNQPLDGDITVCSHQDCFPPMTWPVSDSHFKALVYLQPGPNRLRLDFIPRQRRPSQGQMNGQPAHSSHFQINYLPMNSSPPLHLAILVAKDSPRTFDAVPDRVKSEGNGLETAVRKFRMAAYLWQAFTGEQMNRHGFGRRCFRFEEEWQPGTLTGRDLTTGQMRNEAKIHIITLDKTVVEIQDLNLAQQYEPAKQKGDLFAIAMDAVKNHFKPRPGQKEYVSCMYLDTHWDSKVGTVRGHAALGGGDEQVKLAIFGSHSLQSYPAHLEEVVPAFTDCTKTDTNYVANDCNESGSNWEAANIGIGAHMHETGHLFGCPHQESGVMLRDYVRLNRTFTTREPYSTRTKSQGMRLCLQQDECAWHRLDALRFRLHPCFALPTDMSIPPEDSIQVWGVDKGAALVTASTGIAFIEIYTEGDELCRHWIEYLDPTSGSSTGAPRQITLTEADLRTRVGEANKNKKLKIKIFSLGQGEHEVADFAQHVSKDAKLKLPDGRMGFRGSKVGFSQMDGTKPQEVLLRSSHEKRKLLIAIRVYHGFALDGIEFVYEDGENQLFGKRGGKEGGDEFPINARFGETLLGFNLRAGLWIDGIQILTSGGRRSDWYGNKDGGSGCNLIPPRGYSIAGVYGTCGQWLDGFGLIITR